MTSTSASNAGPRGRNSDHTKVRAVLGWTLKVSLEEGIARTYGWIEEQVRRALDEHAGRAGQHE